ncbi:MAG TPA: large conductance mechanosensitive channel protein MscL [Jiangellaceae bacterium]|nr:large conductance mechanosensitive channel protein MscL [Jiangellaceae bacterium]
MIKGFKEFIMRGNVVDLAVAFVMGVAFAAVVQALIEGLINPLIAAIFGQPNLDDVGTFTINNAEFSIGVFLTALINFLFVAAAIYFFVVVPMNAYKSRRGTNEVIGEEPAEEVVLLRDIRDSLQHRQL